MAGCSRFFTPGKALTPVRVRLHARDPKIQEVYNERRRRLREGSSIPTTSIEIQRAQYQHTSHPSPTSAAFWRIELGRIAPIPVEGRIVKKTMNVFTLWWCMKANILLITFGMLSRDYGLPLWDCALVILFFTLLTTLMPSYCSTLGLKTGTW